MIRRAALIVLSFVASVAGLFGQESSRTSGRSGDLSRADGSGRDARDGAWQGGRDGLGGDRGTRDSSSDRSGETSTSNARHGTPAIDWNNRDGSRGPYVPGAVRNSRISQ